jgi:hypothetical protein
MLLDVEVFKDMMQKFAAEKPLHFGIPPNKEIVTSKSKSLTSLSKPGKTGTLEIPPQSSQRGSEEIKTQILQGRFPGKRVVSLPASVFSVSSVVDKPLSAIASNMYHNIQGFKRSFSVPGVIWLMKAGNQQIQYSLPGPCSLVSLFPSLGVGLVVHLHKAVDGDMGIFLGG